MPALMTPATAKAAFANMAHDTVIEPAFTEFLWQKNANGEVHCHLEVDTVAYTHTDGVTYGPGTFTKGSATGAFLVYFSPHFQAKERTFWWPPGTVSKQPPIQRGQGRFGKMMRWDGVADNAQTAGYTYVAPRSIYNTNTGEFYVTFVLCGMGVDSTTLAAPHFITSGSLRFYCDFSYMLRE